MTGGGRAGRHHHRATGWPRRGRCAPPGRPAHPRSPVRWTVAAAERQSVQATGRCDCLLLRLPQFSQALACRRRCCCAHHRPPEPVHRRRPDPPLPHQLSHAVHALRRHRGSAAGAERGRHPVLVPQTAATKAASSTAGCWCWRPRARKECRKQQRPAAVVVVATAAAGLRSSSSSLLVSSATLRRLAFFAASFCFPLLRFFLGMTKTTELN